MSTLTGERIAQAHQGTQALVGFNVFGAIVKENRLTAILTATVFEGLARDSDR